MTFTSLASVFSIAFMQVLMYFLLKIKDAAAAADYLNLLPILLILLCAGAAMAVKKHGSPDIWVVANGILSIGAACSCLVPNNTGLPFKTAVLTAIVMAIGFWLVCEKSGRLFNRLNSWILIWIASILLLIAMLVFGRVRENTDTITGISILGKTVMLTEFIKLFATLFYASLLSKSEKQFSDSAKLWIATGYMLCCSAILVLMQETGTIMILLFLHLLCLWLFTESSPLKKRYFIIWAVLVLLGAVFLLWLYPMMPLQINLLTKLHNRLKGCLNPGLLDPYDDGYSIFQSIHAIMLGGLFGTSSLDVYLPEAGNDLIYAFVMKNFGAVFGLCVFAMYVVIAVKGLAKAAKLEGTRQILAAAFTILFSCQSLYSIAMNCSFLPVCGITCCLLSRGGMSLIVSMIMIVYIVFTVPGKESVQ